MRSRRPHISRRRMSASRRFASGRLTKISRNVSSMIASYKLIDAVFLPDGDGVEDCDRFSVDLNHTILNALREVLVRRPDADLLHALIRNREHGSRSQRVVGLQLDHRPHRHAHRRERALERMELRPQRRLDALARLVAGPQCVAERFDHVIGRDAEVRGVLLDHLQHRVQHAGHGAERLVFSLVETPLPVEVTEQLVGSVDEVDDHL